VTIRLSILKTPVSLLLVALSVLLTGCNPSSPDYLRGRRAAGEEESEPAPEKKGKGRGDGDGLDPSKDDPASPKPPAPGDGPIDPNDPKAQSFAKQVKPIFDRKCAECHHAGKDLDLTSVPANTKATMQKVVGSVEASATNAMPPSPREKLTADELAAVKAWASTL